MISADFAPNETLSDALTSFLLVFQPWRWQQGRETATLEKRLKDSVFFLTGRSALYHLLLSLNLEKGDEVIVQAFTCEAVILPILANGLRPVFSDIEEETFSLNPIELQKKISSKTRAVILQHSFGILPKHRKKIIDIIKKHNLVLIEDIAHTIEIPPLIPDYKNRYILMSFGRSKALSSVFGGAIIGTNKRVMRRLKTAQKQLPYPNRLYTLRLLLYKPVSLLIKKTYNRGFGKFVHYLSKLINLIPAEISRREKQMYFDMDMDKRYPNALSILLTNQFKNYDSFKKQRINCVNRYNRKLNFGKQTLFSNQPLIRFPLMIDRPDILIKEAKKKNIFLGKWYNRPVAPEDIDMKKTQYPRGSCPVAEKICRKIINLPTNIREKEVDIIVDLINGYQGNNR